MWASPHPRRHDPALGVTSATMQLPAPGGCGEPPPLPPRRASFICVVLPPLPVLGMLTLGGESALESPLHFQVQGRGTWSAPWGLVPCGGAVQRRGGTGQSGLSFFWKGSCCLSCRCGFGEPAVLAGPQGCGGTGQSWGSGPSDQEGEGLRVSLLHLWLCGAA